MIPLVESAVKELLRLMPEKAGKFEGTEFPLPVKTAFLADEPVDIPALKTELLEKQPGDVKYLLEPLLIAAELIESASADRAQYFITDRKTQSNVFTGAKWRAGWVLLLGCDKKEGLVDLLKQRNFMIFTDQAGVPDAVFIGDRATSPIYFLQMMVRYGLVWGRIAPGNDHELGHFLETDMPGFMVIGSDLPALKYLIALGLMKTGAPAVVPSTFPFPYGNRVTADAAADIVEAASRFENLRQRYYGEEVIALPDYCNQAFANQEFRVARAFKGPDSFFCARPGKVPAKEIRIEGEPGAEIGILVEAGEDGFSDDIASVVEAAAEKAINFLPGIRAVSDESGFSVEIGENAEFRPDRLAEALFWGVRLRYPRLSRISVRVIFDPVKLSLMAESVRRYRKKREATVKNMTEENTEEFGACTECRPFSLVHTCILTPDRTPMCAARSYLAVKAWARFGSDVIPYQRRGERALPLRALFNKGKVIDPLKGEYEGANRIYAEMTQGQLKRVQLHSIRECPHTSCGCFQALAFWIGEVQGIGIMGRGSKAVSPDSRKWEQLANAAGGKQAPGIMGVSLQYIRSPKFLRGDGGMNNVVWMDSELHEKIKKILPEGLKIATEKEAGNIRELKTFTGR